MEAKLSRGLQSSSTIAAFCFLSPPTMSTSLSVKDAPSRSPPPACPAVSLHPATVLDGIKPASHGESPDFVSLRLMCVTHTAGTI